MLSVKSLFSQNSWFILWCWILVYFAFYFVLFAGNISIPYKFAICNRCPMASASACHI